MYTYTYFRPLSGFFIFQLVKIHIDEPDKLSFPSPIGVLYISITKKATINTASVKFPSPIGVLYISIVTENTSNNGRKLFPSPIEVLYISIQSATFKRSFDNIAFPSPIGVLYFSIGKMKLYFYTLGFRPLLGFFIFQ